MNAASHIASLGRFPRVLTELVAGISADDAQWKPAPAPGNATSSAGSAPGAAVSPWSILEIVTHLADEEVEDFRMRLTLTLGDPKADWPPIAPEQWARDRKYNEGDLAASLNRFMRERSVSLAWLRSLPESADWSRAHEHPRFGPIHAGDLLAGWAAHDLLHLRQITKRLFQLTGRDAGRFTTRYAGEWTA